MNERTRTAITSGAVALFLVSLALFASAAEDPAKYPSQPIKLIVPFAPAGASDFAARLIQNSMAQFLGRPIIIENRAGAAGNIGMTEAARAAPDGYTLFLGNVGTLSVNPSLFPDLKLKPDNDFLAISLVAETPDILIVSKTFPPNSIKELIEHVKAQPGKVNYASPGSGSLNRLEMEVFRKDAGLNMQHVPYKGGAAPAVTDVLAGHVELMFTTISSCIEQVKSGDLKAFAVTTKERIPALPNVPTMLESGYPNSVSSSWQGVLVPKGTPRRIVDKLYQAVAHAMADAEVRQRMTEGGVLPVVSKSPEEFAEYIAAETSRWAQIAKETGARLD